MSINATLKANLPKNIGMARHLNSKRDENANQGVNTLGMKKPLNCSKSQRVENKMKSKLGNKSNYGSNNENDKNGVNINLNKEVFSKRTVMKENVIKEEKQVLIDEEVKPRSLSIIKTNTESNLVNNDDLNVTMKSSKDDSAIKDQEGEKNFRDQVLGGVIDNEMGNKPVSSHRDFTVEEVDDKSKNQMKTNNFLNKTIKQVNINLNATSNSSQNYENLLINKTNPPKFDSEEYRRMCTKLIRKEYSKSILGNLLEEEEVIEDFLQNHKITERMRCRMVDWMIEVLTNYKCDDYSFFHAINIMDRFFKAVENFKTLQPGELHLLGVTSMFMASKYQDIYPLRLKIVHEKIAHKKLSSEEIKAKEEVISKSLNYIIGKPTQWDFINHFIEEVFFTRHNNYYVNNRTLSETYLEGKVRPNVPSEKDKEMNNLYTKIYTLNMINLLKHVSIYLAKMNCHDYQLMNKKPSLIAASTIFVAMKICEQINKEEYVNDYFTKKLCDISKKSENEIIKSAQKILHNAQNFDTIFTGLENLKRVHFNAIIELKTTK